MNKVIIGNTYRHFKGHLYVVLNLALHTETQETLVIYRRLSDTTGKQLFARPLAMFTSKVDKDKYPDAKQEYRMESVF